MKQLALCLAAMILSAPALCGSLYTMEGGDLRRENNALSLSTVAAPLTLVWASPICDSEPSSNPIILSDRIIQAYHWSVVCRSLVDGSILWNQRNSSVGLIWNPPVYDASRDLLYEGSMNGSVYALRPADGVVMWSLYEGSYPQVSTWGSVVYNNNMIYYCNANRSFVCIDAASRAQIWRFNFANHQGCSTPAIDAGLIYIAGTAGEIAWSKSAA